jgi:hypothetical protein
LNGLRKSESRRPPNRHITGATTGVLSASTKRKRSGRQARAGPAPCSSRGCASRRPAGFPLWPSRNWGILLTPLLVLRFGGAGRRRAENACVWGPRRRGPKNPRRFWSARRPRNEKPGAVSRTGLGHTPEGYLFIHESRFKVQKSQVCKSQVASHKLHRSHKLHHAQVVSGIPRSICWAPHRWRPSNEKPGAVSRPGLDTLFKRGRDQTRLTGAPSSLPLSQKHAGADAPYSSPSSTASAVRQFRSGTVRLSSGKPGAARQTSSKNDARTSEDQMRCSDLRGTGRNAGRPGLLDEAHEAT